MKLVLILFALLSTAPLALADYDREAIRRVVRSGLSDIKKCYEVELEKKPGLSGRVVLELEINKAGEVRSVKADPTGSLTDTDVLECMYKVSKKWKFPGRSDDIEVTVVSYPFLFDRQERVKLDKRD